jgi:hypothetical protein
MPPNKKNGPRSTTSETRSNDLMAANDIPKVHNVSDERNTSAQLPIVLAATIYTPAYGMTMALVVPDDACPACGFWHSHRIKYPAPVLVVRKARCGQRYELALHAPRPRRSRRAA